MTTAWSIQPVCDGEFWRIVALSPEVLIFLFFMITDPKTIPDGRFARIVFAASIAALSALLIAPQTQEFGAKVALLSGLVLLTPLRAVFDRVFAEGRSAVRRPALGQRTVFAIGAVFGAVLVVVSVGMVRAGAVARTPAPPSSAADMAFAVEIDPSTIPTVTVSAEAAALQGGATDDPQALGVALIEDLTIEGEAMARLDSSLLRAADTGERLLERERAVEIAATTGPIVVDAYRFDALNVDVAYTAGPQGGASLAMEATGTVDHVTLDASGLEVASATEAFSGTFVITLGSDGRWLIAQLLPTEVPAIP